MRCSVVLILFFLGLSSTSAQPVLHSRCTEYTYLSPTGEYRWRCLPHPLLYTQVGLPAKSVYVRYAQRIANRVTRCQRHDTPAACVLDTANACQLGAHVFGIDVGSCTTLEWHAAVYDELGPGSYGSAYYCQGSMAAEAARCKRVLQALRYRCGPGLYCANSTASTQAEQQQLIGPASSLCKSAGCAFWQGRQLLLEGTVSHNNLGNINTPSPAAPHSEPNNHTNALVSACLPRSYANASEGEVAQLHQQLRRFNFTTVGDCTGTRFYASVLPHLDMRTNFELCDQPAMRFVAFYMGDKGLCAYDPEHAPITRSDPMYALYADVDQDCRDLQESLMCQWQGGDSSMFRDVPYFVADLEEADIVAAQFHFPVLDSSTHALCLPSVLHTCMLVLLLLLSHAFNAMSILL